MRRPKLDQLTLRLDGPVATITLDRPEVLNALSVELLDELVTACGWLAEQAQLRVVVVRGAGRSFSAGADLATLPRLLAEDGSARGAADAGDRAARALEALPQITLAAIHGRCVGGGIVLALACDLRVAADSAWFSIPEVDLGIPLAWGGVPRLLREVGPAVARDLVLSCRPFDAGEARALGVVSRVLPDDQLDHEVAVLAGELAAKPRLAVRATLDAVATAVGVGSRTGWSDADTLLAAVRDPECQAAGRRYLDERVGGGAPGPGTDEEHQR